MKTMTKLNTYDVFISENRAGGSTQYVGTIEAATELDAMNIAGEQFECDSTHSLSVEITSYGQSDAAEPLA